MKKWIIILLIVVGLLLLTGGGIISSLDSKYKERIRQKDAKIGELNLEIDDLKVVESDQIKEIDKLKTEKSDLAQKHKNVLLERKRGEKIIKALEARIAKMSTSERDKLLIDLLKKHNVDIIEITETQIVITIENRHKLLKLIVNYNKVTGDIVTWKAEVQNLKKQLAKSDEIIKKEKDLNLTKDNKYKKLEKKYGQLEGIRSDLKKRLTLAKIGGFFKRTLPALIVGIVIGKFILDK